MDKIIKIGTRESQLAEWQALHVQALLKDQGYQTELVYIKSEGDIDLTTPLYAMGVQGVFTRSLDIALLSGKIDIAVHSMKDVPTQLPKGIVQSAVLDRANYLDLFVPKQSLISEGPVEIDYNAIQTIGTSSIRRKAQWLHKYPHHQIENIRGNVNTRLKKVVESNWAGAIFAAAGLERISLKPEHSIHLDWMLPAPAQGAIMIVCKEDDIYSYDASSKLNDSNTAICTKIERDFLKELLGGCSTPISALATIKESTVSFKGNIVAIDGKEKAEIALEFNLNDIESAGAIAASKILENGGKSIIDTINHAK